MSTNEQSIRQSNFIFKGSVKKLGASNLKMLPGTDRTAIIHVHQVVYAAKTLNDFTGQDITVQLAEPHAVQPGQEAVFFSKTWLFGEHLAVVEVGHMPPEVNVEELRKEVATLQQKMEDEKIQARIELASLVIVGKVSRTRPLEKQRDLGPVTEHDPDPWIADVEVQVFLKGTVPAPLANVLFPRSTDVMWAYAPKFYPGQEGIWFLQRDKSEQVSRKLGAVAFAALDPLDFQPMAELERIKRLVAEIQK